MAAVINKRLAAVSKSLDSKLVCVVGAESGNVKIQLFAISLGLVLWLGVEGRRLTGKILRSPSDPVPK